MGRLGCKQEPLAVSGACLSFPPLDMGAQPNRGQKEHWGEGGGCKTVKPWAEMRCFYD